MQSSVIGMLPFLLANSADDPTPGGLVIRPPSGRRSRKFSQAPPKPLQSDRMLFGPKNELSSGLVKDLVSFIDDLNVLVSPT